MRPAFRWLLRAVAALGVLVALEARGAGGGAAAAARETSAGDAPIVRQDTVGANSCGFCAVYHAFSRGGAQEKAALAGVEGRAPADKIARLIESHGAKPSEAYAGKRKRFEPASGITWTDLGAAVGEFCDAARLAPVQSGYLDRDAGEPHPAHARRVHRLLRDSLAAGFPPLLSLRSFAARERDGAKVWDALVGHWVAVVDVQQEMGEAEQGFRFGFIDSETGSIQWGYAFADDTRWFTAAKGDGARYEWLTDSPFLALAAPKPSMATGAEPWSARTVVVLNFAIHRPAR